jgi:ABC-type transport system involved in multi-copper enzyme maturation permease subunit
MSTPGGITPSWITTVAWLVRDTFRQSLASGVCWLLLATTIICTLVCLSVTVDGQAQLQAPGENPEFLPRGDRDAADLAAKEGVPVVSGRVKLGFGTISVPLARDAKSAVCNLQLLFAGGVADTLGLLLTLVWTAGFLPQFLDRRHISVLLTKPAPRWCLLAGKYIGVLTFVLLHAVLFVGGTWLALGVRTGVWNASYWWCVPLLVLHFAIFFGFSLLLAVTTRSTVVCVFGSILFWFICWGMNFGRHTLVLAQQVAPEATFSTSLGWLAEAGYWILPKPADFSILLFDALDAQGFFRQQFDLQALRDAGLFSLELSILTSLAFTAYLFIASARQFATADY